MEVTYDLDSFKNPNPTMTEEAAERWIMKHYLFTQQIWHYREIYINAVYAYACHKKHAQVKAVDILNKLCARNNSKPMSWISQDIKDMMINHAEGVCSEKEKNAFDESLPVSASSPVIKPKSKRPGIL